MRVRVARGWAVGVCWAAAIVWLPRSATAAPLASARVYVDNGTPDALEIFVDGRKAGDVAGWDIRKVDAAPGKHAFEVRKGGAPVDRVETNVLGGHTQVFNPNAVSDYQVFAGVYAVTPAFVFGTGTGSHTLKTLRGRNWVCEKVDYDLFDEMPTTIPMGGRGTTTRLKIHKVPRSSLSPEEAQLILTKNLAAYHAAGASSVVGGAIRALKGEGLTPARAEMLFSFLEKSPVGHESDAAAALMGFAGPEHFPRIRKLLIESARTGEGKSYDTRTPAAAALFVSTYSSDEIREVFGQIGDHGKWNLMDQAESRLRGTQPDKLLQLRSELGPVAVASTNATTASKGLDFVQDRKLALNADFVRRVDAALAGFGDEKTRLARQTVWNRHLADVFGDTRDAGLAPRVEPLLAFPDANVQTAAASSLCRAGRPEPVAAAYAGMLPDARRHVMYGLRGMRGGDPWPLLQLGLRDGVPEVREAAFQASSDTGSSDELLERPGVLEALVNVCRAETDPKTASNMCSRLQWSVGAPDVKLPQVAPLLLWTIETGNVHAIPRAVNKLGRMPDKATNWQQYRDLFRRIPKEEQRVILVDQAPNMSVADEAEAEFFVAALADSSAKVREAAFTQLCRNPQRVSEANWAVLRNAVVNEADAAVKTKMDRAYKIAYLHLLRDRPGADRRSPEFQQAVVGFVVDDVEVAREAVRLLDGTALDSTLTALTEAYPKVGDEIKNAISWAVCRHPNAAALGLYRTGMGDPKTGVRRAAFEALCRRYHEQKEPEAAEILRAAAKAEVDRDLKERWDREIRNLRL